MRDMNESTTLLERAEQLSKENRDVLAELTKARQPGYSQPREVISKFMRQQSQTQNKPTPFKDYGHFMKCVHQCPNGQWQNHPEMTDYLMKALPSGMNITQAMDGGFLVPPEFVNQLLMRTYANDLLSRTTMFPMTTSNTLKIPAINETSRADGSRFGGVQAYWDGESDTITATKPNIGQVTLTANRLTMAIRATQELLDDAASLETWLNVVADQELAFKIGDAIVNGDGVNKPLGIINASSPSLISQAKETGQAANTIVSQNVMKMYARLHVSCRANAIWLYDQSIEPQLWSMTVGTAGAALAVFMPPGGLSGLPYATILGRPAIAVEFCKQLGTQGDLILVDPGTILSAMKSGIMAANSIHVYFLSNEQVFRFVMRLDARSWWISALTPKSAGNTQSNIVALAARS